MDWLKRFFSRRKRQESHTVLWIYVRCHRCGEPLRVRADQRYDLASEWRDAGEAGPAYTMHKDIVGERCFQRISVDLAFDHHLQIIEQRIVGGDVLSEAEYTASLASPPPRLRPSGAQEKADETR